MVPVVRLFGWYVHPFSATLSIMKVNVVRDAGFLFESEVRLTAPLLSVIPVSLSVVASCQWPDTVAPATACPFPSTTVIWAIPQTKVLGPDFRVPNDIEMSEISKTFKDAS